MNRSLLIVLLGLLLLGGLVTFELVSLGIIGGDEDAAGDGAVDLLGAEGEAPEDGATLEGRAGGRRVPQPEGEAAPLVAVPAEVHGSTPNGGSVRGRVVREADGLPVPGVRVTLGRPDSLISYLRAKVNGRFDALEARTGSDGRFAFLDVTPSKGYVVRARHRDFAICSHPEDLDLRGRDAIDVGDLRLGTGGALTGRVVGPDGTPLPNVRVAITWRITNAIGIILADPETAPEIEREVRTDDKGRWQAARLDPGPKTIFAVAPTGASQIVRSVGVEAGGLKTVDDIRMPGAGAIAGRVVWADGSPIVGARVFAAQQMGSAVRTVETDAEGAFRLAWLPEGEGFVLGTLVAGLPVDLRQGVPLGAEDVRIEFPLPGALEGVVVADDGQTPVPAFAVQLEPMEPPEDMQMRFILEQVKRGLGPTPFTGDDGRFALPRVAPGAYHVVVSAPGFPDATSEPFGIVAGETHTLRIQMPRGHVGKGVVLRSDGAPLAGARVHVIANLPPGTKGHDLGPYFVRRSPDAIADAHGRFTLPPQTPGRYALIAERPDVLAGALHGVDLETGDANGLEVTLPPCATVRGRLLDEHARPAKGETVYIVYRSGLARIIRADDEGRFEMKGLPLGRCIVRWLSMRDMAAYGQVLRQREDEEARHRAFDELAVAAGGEHDLRDGSVIDLTLSIPRRVVVRGRYTAAGELVPEARFFVTIAGGGHWVQVDADEDGRFETRLLPGAYLVYGPGKDGDWKTREVEILEGPSQTLDVDMR